MAQGRGKKCVWLFEREDGWHGFVEYPNGNYSRPYGPYESELVALVNISAQEGQPGALLDLARAVSLRGATA